MQPLKIVVLTLATSTLFALHSSTDAFAAKKVTRKVQPEVYSATEPGVVTITTTTAVPLQAAPAPADAEEQETPPPPPAAPESAPAPVVSVSETAPSLFDPVPSDQAALIAKRLPLIEKLMVKHGRAYDYRTHTVKQLETICAELDRAENQP